ncbi:nucleotidyltransferase family protein [Tenacibaculum ovolyticum]|uniref:nucleotidyltransferase family protein n=1 Tax=Tenacibaculum ovolyticum TaxID=104270 RepID=UPI003BAA6D97
MNYKETLFFVGKCLTLTYEKHNRDLVENKLKSNTVDWDNVVKLTTSHYVLPALYCNLKRADFLHYLPEDLVGFMEHITDLNRDRNLKIIKQAKEINELLLANSITPIFLKGTGNLLEGLYEDIGERMIGDIDFIVDKNIANKTLKVLSQNQYTHTTNLPNHITYIKHYPRMIKKGCINAIEVHLEMTMEKFSSIFNYQTIKPNLRKKEKFTLLSYEDQISHTIINKQLNDYGYLSKNIALRNYYDLFLLSFKTNTLKSINKFPTIFKQLNSFLAIASFIFPNTKNVFFKEELSVIYYKDSVFKLLDNPKKAKRREFFIKFYFTTYFRINLLLKALYSKNHFIYVLNKMRDIKWYKRLLNINR